eukprot:CAMPEP_0194516948 /NCGR_PEP_ID=MMETSP0253-20130528/50000_1 /TAXON_ID=2966 /ORGANISM="Noctiluca scintillans" /LENGTH=144 /DNA_ID=CAMNT_0039360863 /DNA_START=9 /DNA_END=443 /DNA_ORIENTATION=-
MSKLSKFTHTLKQRIATSRRPKRGWHSTPANLSAPADVSPTHASVCELAGEEQSVEQDFGTVDLSLDLHERRLRELKASMRMHVRDMSDAISVGLDDWQRMSQNNSPTKAASSDGSVSSPASSRAGRRLVQSDTTSRSSASTQR